MLPLLVYSIIRLECILQFRNSGMHSSRADTYLNRKREASIILKRISAKQLQQIKSARSSGFQMQNVFKTEIKRQINKAKTQAQTIKNGRRHTDPLSKPAQPPKKHKKISLSLQSRKYQMGDSLDQEAEADQIAQGEATVPNTHSNEYQQSSAIVAAALPCNAQSPIFRPQLHKLINDPFQSIAPETRFLIIQLMVLCVVRRANKKLIDALETILLLSETFSEFTQLKILKEMWLQLIGKIWSEIMKEMQDGTAKKKRRRSEIKKEMTVRRQSHVVIKSLASQRVFNNRFSNSMKKAKLIYQSAYSKQKKNEDNVRRSSKVLSRLTVSCAISYPSPLKLFPEIPALPNYDVVVVSKDPQNHLFPYSYPRTLHGILQRREYMQRIVQINAILVPQTRCYDKDSTIGLSFEYLLLVFVVLLFYPLGMLMGMEGRVAAVVLCLVFFLCIVLAVCIQNKSTKVKNIAQIYEKMEMLCKAWQDCNKHEHVKIVMSESTQNLIIAVPSYAEEEESVCSSESFSSSEEEIEEEPNQEQISLNDQLDMIEEQPQISMRQDQSEQASISNRKESQNHENQLIWPEKVQAAKTARQPQLLQEGASHAKAINDRIMSTFMRFIEAEVQDEQEESQDQIIFKKMKKKPRVIFKKLSMEVTPRQFKHLELHRVESERKTERRIDEILNE